MRPDNRPFLVLAGVLLVVAAAFALPATRGPLSDAVVDPLRAQAAPETGPPVGYTPISLAFWAFVGAAIAWAAYELAFVRAGLQADRAFFLSLAPALVFGPLYHALLVAGRLPYGSVWAYLAAEPLVYLTSAAVATLCLATGRFTRSAWQMPLAVGGLLLLPLVVLAAPLVGGRGLVQALIILGIAVAAALALAYAYRRARNDVPFSAAAAVIGAHALDGATTWMVLRDPLGMGFEGFGERNPVSETLVNLSNGWPYFVIKLALPVVLLWLVKPEEGEERMHAFILFAIFVLGYGPGMSNLLQVILG